MATLNKVMLIGRLTDNPEPPRTLPNSGSKVVKFRMAVGRSKKNPQTGQWENDPNPLYIDCEAFSYPDARRDLVGLISQYLTKGSQVYLDGRLQLDNWDDKTTGQKRSKHKVVIENIEFLDTRPQGSGGDYSGRNNSGGEYDDGGGQEAPRQNYAPSKQVSRPPAPKPGPGYSPPPAEEPQGDGEIPF